MMMYLFNHHHLYIMRKNLAEYAIFSASAKLSYPAKMAAPPSKRSAFSRAVTMDAKAAEPAVDKRFGFLSGCLLYGKGSMVVKMKAHWESSAKMTDSDFLADPAILSYSASGRPRTKAAN
jgi:hypothetical protein